MEESVNEELSGYDAKSNEVVDQVKNHVHSVLADSLSKNVLKSSSNTDNIIKIFKEKKIIKIPLAELREMGFMLDYPNKVFREVKTEGRWFVEPSTQAISLILSENVQNDNNVHELSEKMFRIAS